MNDSENIKIEELRNLIRKFNNDENVTQLDNYYNSKCLPEILGTSRKELVHSNFLAWIINESESHQLLDFPLRKFLELIVININDRQKKKYKNLFDSIIVSDYSISDLYIETERFEKGVGRIDLYIEVTIQINGKRKRLRLIIENKVGSNEQDNQTTKYYNYYENLNEKKLVNLYVFLTPISSLDLEKLREPECSCKEYTQLNYQLIVDFILEPALKRNITSKTEFIIKQYLQSLSQPTIDKDNVEYNQGLIMALGTEERNLLNKFWEKNQKLILATLYAISSDKHQEEDVRDDVSSALSSLSNRDYSKFEFKGVVYNKSRLVNKVVKSYVEEYPTVTYAELEKAFPDWIQGSYGIFTTKENAQEKYKSTGYKYKRFYIKVDELIELSDETIATCTEWGLSNITKFVNHVNEFNNGFRIDIKY